MSKMNYTTIQGFEDYKILNLGQSCLESTYGFYIPYSYMYYPQKYVINKNLPFKVYLEQNPIRSYLQDTKFEHTPYTDHKELLKDGARLYTHSCCRLSRSMMAEKYKKCLNPWEADAIVMPKPDANTISIRNYALFVNELYHVIVMVDLYNDTMISLVSSWPTGKKFSSCVQSQPGNDPGNGIKESVMDSELFYVGEMLCVPSASYHMVDVFSGTLPLGKTVYEESVQETLGTEDNKLDFDSLISIKDMLDSSDADTVSAGFKSLSMMDWMHYPNSVKFIIKQTNRGKWYYNKALSSTSVKYMMQQLSGTSVKRRFPGDYNMNIHEQDFELFKKLKMHYDHVPEDKIIASMMVYEFMTVKDGMAVPNLVNPN